MTESEHSTDEAARAELLRRRLSARRDRRVPLTRQPRGGALPLSFAQEQLWFLQRLRPDSAEYVLPVALRLSGALDPDALSASVGDVVRRHEVLRTRIVTVAGEPVQLVTEPGPVDVARVDMTGSGLEGFQEYACRQARVPFTLDTESPLKATLVAIGDEDHVLLLILHHAVFDGWSIDLLVTELARGYAARVGAETPPPDRVLQYADYAAWQREWMSGDRLDREIEYWRTRLADAAPTEVAPDHSRPSRWEPRGGVVSVRVPATVAADLVQVGTRVRATPFMVFFAAFSVLLSRYAATEDVVVGTPVAGRTRQETEDMIGFFVNSVVLRNRVIPDEPFSSAVERTRDEVLESFSHQDLPFDRLVAALAPNRDLARNSLFQIVFAMQGGTAATPAGFGSAAVRAELVPVENDTAKFDLTWTLEPQADGSYTLDVQYATALYEPGTAERMARHYLELLTAIAADPDRPVGRLDLFSAEDRAVLTADPVIANPRTGLIHHRFATVAARAPESVAVVSTRRTLTYGELDRCANRLAHRLRELGVGPERCVAVLMDREVDVVVAMLAVLKAGGAYVPLDPAHPDRRLARMVADTSAVAVVTDEATCGRALALPAPTVALAEAEHCTDTAPDVTVDEDNLAYVIFTSGSTGEPKGVAVTHANMVRLLTALEAEFDFGADDVWSCTHSYAFDFSVWEIWAALLYGGRTVVVGSEIARSPRDLVEVLRTTGVTRLSQTPSAFTALTDVLTAGAAPWPTLRTVVFGGEALTTASLRPWFTDAPSPPTFINMFGITETTVHVTYREIGVDDTRLRHSPVGRPIRDLAIRLLDARGDLTPLGAPGEIHVGGPGVARGYLGRPGLTAARFVPDPFARVPGARLYRSGDLGRFAAPDELIYLGRADQQVKIRGFRIELGEVEAALLTHPGVAAAVVGTHDDGTGRGLIAHVVPSRKHELTISGLRAFLADLVPAHMIPSWWVELHALPTTSTGKVDRKALPAPDGGRPRVGASYAAPRTETEEKVAGIWSEVLGVRDVGVHDGFFHLGGDSIKAVRLAGRLDASGFAVTVADVFAHQTVAELATAVAGATTRTEGPVEPFALVSDDVRVRLPQEVADAYPVSAVQAGMLYEMLADAEVNRYHNVTSLFIQDRTPFDRDAFQAAFDLMVDRHEALRTSFDLDGFAEPLQLVWESARTMVTEHDLRGHDSDAQRAEVERFVTERRSRVLDVARAPLLCLDVHRIAESAFWLSVTECHAILDGWSHHGLIGDLMAEYRAVLAGSSPVRAAAPGRTRYADFVAAEQVAVASAESRQFWAARLTGAEPARIPSTWGDVAPGEFDDCLVDFSDLETRLRGLATACGTPFKSVLLAAHAVVLGEISGLRRFHTGLVCNGRLEVDGGDDVRGMFLNTVPFLAELTAPRWRDLVAAVFRAEVELLPHRRFPLPVMKQLWPETSPVPDIIFNFLDFRAVDDATLDRTRAIDRSPNEAALHVSTEPGALVLTGELSRIGRTHLRELGALYRAVLSAMAEDFDGDAHQAFQPEDQVTRWAEWNDTSARFPGEALLDRVALQPPGDPAVVCGGRTVTYGELNAEVVRLASVLRAKGVGPESVVAVMLPRGVDLIAGLLAVYAAGAAYLPVDPSHPPRRVAHQLSDAGVAAILTRSDVDVVVDVDSPVVLIDRIERGRDGAVRPVSAAPDNLAYVIYTSGSTGVPKGVGVSRSGMDNFLRDLTEAAGMSADTVLVAVTTVSFDIAVLELFGPLTTGGTVVVADHEEAADPETLSGLVRRTGATIMQATPVTWQLLLDGGWSPPAGFTVLCGGEAPSSRLVAALSASPATVLELYGPTETTVWSMRGPMRSGGTPWRPVANTAVHVLDADLRSVRDGVAGELCIAGAGLARGYLGRPGLTADRFRPDACSQLPGGRLYRTGDLAVRDTGGLTVLGRLDQQVKVRGHRIELGEVEAVVTAAAAAEAVVVTVRGVPPDQELVACLVPGPAGSPDIGAVRRAVSETLPDYMVPTRWVEIDAVPRTLNGKVDRGALPEADGRRGDIGTPHTPPRTAAERAVAEVWAEVLGVDRVGVHDDFFDLGGHSLLALRAIGVLRREHGMRVSLRDLVVVPTVAGLVAAVAGQDGSDRERAAIWYRAEGTEPPLFCVHPGGGSGHWYEPLANALGPGQPVAAFEWPGLNGPPLPLRSVDDMADRYLAEMRARYPHGPYRLLGWCGGAPVAWEMATRLRRAGEEVDFSLLDPVNDLWIKENFAAELAVLTRCDDLLEMLTEADPEEYPEARAEVVAILRSVVDDDRGVEISTTAFDLGWHQRVRVWRWMLAAQMAYPFRPLPGPLRLILGDEVADGRHEVISGKPLSDYIARWRALVDGEVRVARVPGDHFTVLRPPDVAELARVVAS